MNAICWVTQIVMEVEFLGGVLVWGLVISWYHSVSDTLEIDTRG